MWRQTADVSAPPGSSNRGGHAQVYANRPSLLSPSRSKAVPHKQPLPGALLVIEVVQTKWTCLKLGEVTPPSADYVCKKTASCSASLTKFKAKIRASTRRLSTAPRFR